MSVEQMFDRLYGTKLSRRKVLEVATTGLAAGTMSLIAKYPDNNMTVSGLDIAESNSLPSNQALSRSELPISPIAVQNMFDLIFDRSTRSKSDEHTLTNINATADNQVILYGANGTRLTLTKDVITDGRDKIRNIQLAKPGKERNVRIIDIQTTDYETTKDADPRVRFMAHYVQTSFEFIEGMEPLKFIFDVTRSSVLMAEITGPTKITQTELTQLYNSLQGFREIPKDNMPVGRGIFNERLTA